MYLLVMTNSLLWKIIILFMGKSTISIYFYGGFQWQTVELPEGKPKMPAPMLEGVCHTLQERVTSLIDQDPFKDFCRVFAPEPLKVYILWTRLIAPLCFQQSMNVSFIGFTSFPPLRRVSMDWSKDLFVAGKKHIA